MVTNCVLFSNLSFTCITSPSIYILYVFNALCSFSSQLLFVFLFIFTFFTRSDYTLSVCSKNFYYIYDKNLYTCDWWFFLVYYLYIILITLVLYRFIFILCFCLFHVNRLKCNVSWCPQCMLKILFFVMFASKFRLDG